MRAWSLKGKVVIGFALAFVVLAAALWIVSRSTQRLIAAGHSVTSTQEVLTELRSARALMQEAESALRGAVLTAEPSFLESYDAVVRRVHPQVARLAMLTAGEPAPLSRVRRLEKRIDEKLDWSARAIARLKDQGPNAARAMVLSSEGFLLSSEIQRELNGIELEELQLLALRRRRPNRMSIPLFSSLRWALSSSSAFFSLSITR